MPKSSCVKTALLPITSRASIPGRTGIHYLLMLGGRDTLSSVLFPCFFAFQPVIEAILSVHALRGLFCAFKSLLEVVSDNLQSILLTDLL